MQILIARGANLNAENSNGYAFDMIQRIFYRLYIYSMTLLFCIFMRGLQSLTLFMRIQSIKISNYGEKWECYYYLTLYDNSVHDCSWTPLMVARSWHRNWLEGILSRQPEARILTPPSPYLSLPLMSIMGIARLVWRMFYLFSQCLFIQRNIVLDEYLCPAFASAQVVYALVELLLSASCCNLLPLSSVISVGRYFLVI